MSSELKSKLNLETAKIAWAELQLFFASGKAVSVDTSLDMIDVACAMHLDHAAQIQDWMAKGLIGQVSDDQAKSWHKADAEVWALVIRPWVLVQSCSID